MNIKKHVGKIKSTDRRCVVVYTQIPGMIDHALIIDTDALPDKFHDGLMEIVDSSAGQESINLAEVLSRKQSIVDQGVDFLYSLHFRNMLQRQPIDNIIMLPMPHYSMPLSEIIKLNGGSLTPVVEVCTPTQAVEKFNRVAENIKLDNKEKNTQIANSILREAQDLEDEVQRKRERAYQQAPHLRPLTQHLVIDTLESTESTERMKIVNKQNKKLLKVI